MRKKLTNRMNEDFDPDLKLDLVVNAIYFDDPYFLSLVLREMPKESDLPAESDVINRLMSDKDISDEEAYNKYSEFINKHYKEDK